MNAKERYDHKDERSLRTDFTPLGVCILPPPAANRPRTAVVSEYLCEILDHAGIGLRRLQIETLSDQLHDVSILLTVGEAPLTDRQRQGLGEWVREGGAWISIAGLCGMQEITGMDYATPSEFVWGGSSFCGLGEGYLQTCDTTHRIIQGIERPLHFFRGLALERKGAHVLAEGLDIHHARTGRPLLAEHHVGDGLCVLIAPDLPGSVAHIQHGLTVTRDGMSAPDGSAPVDDGVLKSDDGLVLDWIFDRLPLPGFRELRLFLMPIADQWRDLLLRTILYCAEQRQVVLPLLWFYPSNVPALVHLSHDTDQNDPALAEALLESLAEIGAQSTWCVIAPGYPGETIRRIRDAGHELAIHFDAMSDGLSWTEDEFDRQWQILCTLFGAEEKPVSNKNHYLRWEGNGDHLHWCIERGIRVDQTKGPSKTGNGGFLFGTCHPFFPMDSHGKLLDILELPTLTQDLGLFAPDALGAALIATCARHYGIAHLLFHPAHWDKPAVVESIHHVADWAAGHGMPFWTARRIDAWERARRRVTWTQTGLKADAALKDAAILFLAGEPARITLNGMPLPVEKIERWGFPFLSVVVDLEPGREYRFQVENGGSQA